jgi:hypothetical protein
MIKTKATNRKFRGEKMGKKKEDAINTFFMANQF